MTAPTQGSGGGNLRKFSMFQSRLRNNTDNYLAEHRPPPNPLVEYHGSLVQPYAWGQTYDYTRHEEMQLVGELRPLVSVAERRIEDIIKPVVDILEVHVRSDEQLEHLARLLKNAC